MPRSPKQWLDTLAEVDYFIDVDLAETLHVHWSLRDAPILFEGDAGSGKTMLVEAIGLALDIPIYRLQCYEGINPSLALYTWNTQLQKLLTEFSYRENNGIPQNLIERLYNEKTMVPGIFLKALMDPHPHTVILIDEIDKLDQAFEATMLEFLGSFKVTVAEMNRRYVPVSGKEPHVFLTSNAGIEGSSKRKCLSYPILRRCRRVLVKVPTKERQFEIICSRIPNISIELAEEIVLAIEYFNNRTRLDKPISISEILMWARRLAFRRCKTITNDVLNHTISDIAKLERDQQAVLGASSAMINIISKKRGSLAGEKVYANTNESV